MIQDFRHKGLARLFIDGNQSGVRADQRKRVELRLVALDDAEKLEDLKLPGWGPHELQVSKRSPRRWAIAVNGPWRITFEWRDGHAHGVDLEQYH